MPIKTNTIAWYQDKSKNTPLHLRFKAGEGDFRSWWATDNTFQSKAQLVETLKDLLATLKDVDVDNELGEVGAGVWWPMNDIG